MNSNKHKKIENLIVKAIKNNIHSSSLIYDYIKSKYKSASVVDVYSALGRLIKNNIIIDDKTQKELIDNQLKWCKNIKKLLKDPLYNPLHTPLPEYNGSKYYLVKK